MIGNDETVSTSQNYQRFATLEARGRSPLYEQFCQSVAADHEVLELITSLPAAKRQPNLLLAAVKYLYGTSEDYPSFRRQIIDHWSELSATMLERRTQTNEVGRCATLLPLLVSLPQPLALLEVGASAGLCLLPDRYRYDYGAGVFGNEESPVLIRCQPGTATPVPDRLPEVVWRKGIDLDPIDPSDESATAWLEALVWPEQGDRLARLRAALAVARQDPPPVARGDLRDGLGRITADVPGDATLVVFHSAVLAYVPAEDRERFASEVVSLGAVWIANEGSGVFPAIRQQLGDEELAEHPGGFLVSCNGAPIAWADPHGAWVNWRQDPNPPANRKGAKE
jgi:hypothetical protein